MTHPIVRRAGVVLLVMAAMATCVLLGFWQWHRHTDRVAQVALITTNLDTPTVPVAELIPPQGDLDPSDIWRSVTLRGEFIADSGVQLRNRPVADANASHALALFRTAEDPARVIVVDRGWWRQTDVVDPALLATPQGETEIVIRLRAAEALDERTAPAGEAYRVDPATVMATAVDGGALVGQDSVATSFYGIQTLPSPENGLGPLPDPDTSLRSHLSYALQWWFFAALIPVAAVIIAKRAREEREFEQGAPRPVARAGRKPTMEDEEDAILDAQEALDVQQSR